MSNLLWKAYYEDDFDAFQRLLEGAPAIARPYGGRGGVAGPVIGSPGQVASSPTVHLKGRKSLGPPTPSSGGHAAALTKGDINARDAFGATLLHYAASSTAENAIDFATALIEHPLIDLFVQDYESGWTALHRAFYFGNVTIARLMLERDAGDAVGEVTGHVHSTVGLIKVKDRDGYGPLDLYAAIIKDRTLRTDTTGRARSGSGHSDDERMIGDAGDADHKMQIPFNNVDCDQLFTFGSNKNATLGFSNEDDRQFPERITLRRPEALLRRFYSEHLEQHDKKWSHHDPGHRSKHTDIDVSEMWVEDIPWVIRSKPLVVQDAHMAKFHSAVLTADPESNLYVCGHGQGGRLGVGDERTRYNFVCVNSGALAGKRVVAVALGLNHTLALSSEGETFSWGSNAHGQLGLSLPKSPAGEDEPISTLPKQLFGPLKRETVVGIAASRHHSVAHTGSSLFTFGKNEGQLGIVDSDARSLEVQTTPRKVAASLFASNITSVSAMDKATVCLLESHEVWIFANYGYTKVQFPLDGFSNYFLQKSFRVTTYDNAPNRIVKLTCGGDTVCALSSRGEIYTVSISSRMETPPSSSTTNPSKIRSAITQPQRVWQPKKSNMAARDVGVDADGSIILSTEEGSVWKRTKRAKIKDATASGASDYKPKDYKFSRIPGLTRVLAVRASSHGAYAAARRDCNVLKTQIAVDEPRLHKDIFSLLSLRGLEYEPGQPLRFWQAQSSPNEVQALRRRILQSKDIEGELQELQEQMLTNPVTTYDALICTTTSDVTIPIHRFVLTGRSRTMRRGFRDLCETSTFTVPDLCVSEIDKDGRAVVKFQGLDILTIIDLVVYLYTDSLVDFWHFTRNAPSMAHRYRQVRTELMKIATKLDLRHLEPAARQMVQPVYCLDMDFAVAFQDPAFFYDGDFTIQLEDEEIRAHSWLLRKRCPFFEGLFMGRAGGRWVDARDNDDEVHVDLSHINSKTFRMVLQWIYADCGEELFDDLVSVSLDDFLDAVMDVLSAANELLLDRLSQICQAVMGRYVNVRNVCGLLNAISPSSVHEFKDAGLEYLCLSLEAMLQGHHLNELDEDLLLELDAVVRSNQLACMPFAKSGFAEESLHERHPGLADAVERGRQARLDALTLRAKYANLERQPLGGFDEELTSPLQQKGRGKPPTRATHDASQPSLKGKQSSKDMMFAMDEEVDLSAHSPTPSPSIRAMTKGVEHEAIPSSLPEEVWYDSRGKALPSPTIQPQTMTPAGTTPKSPALRASKTPPTTGQPWSLTPLSAHPKVDMKSIMENAASNRTSSLSQGLASANFTALDAMLPQKAGVTKMSQKDRKRLQHSAVDTATIPEDVKGPGTLPALSAKPGSAWQTIPTQKPVSVKDVLGLQDPASKNRSPNPRTQSTPQLTMRQTISNPKPPNGLQTPIVSPSGQSSLPRREVPDPKSPAQAKSPSWQQSPASSSRSIPQSIRHRPAVPDPSIVGLSMSEIVAQEQLAKDVIKEAAAKRDLQEIQAEQEFEEWWSKESARVQEAERRDAAAAVAGKSSRARKPKGRGGLGGGPVGGKPKGEKGNVV